MSSTHRGAERNEHDYYVTPPHCIVQFLQQWAADEPEISHINTVLDPCAGGTIKEGRVVVPMSYPLAIKQADLFPWVVSTNDIRGDSPADIVRNYLTSNIEPAPDLIITNPPFNIALSVIQKALKDVADGGYVVMLLRLNFFGAECRSAWLKANMPERCYVHSKRIGFKEHLTHLPLKERKGTDSIEYMHAVWLKGHQPKATRLSLI